VRALALTLGVALAGACTSAEPSLPPDLPAIGGQASLLRLPRKGGIVEAYLADSLAEPVWTTRVAVGPVREVLGVNPEARLLLAIDSSRKLVAVDLESRGVRQLATGVGSGVFVPDGSVYAVSAGARVTRYDLSAPTPYRETLPPRTRRFLGTLGDRFVTVTDAESPELVIYNAERRVHAAPVPDGPVAATHWGDLVAIASGTRISLFGTGEPFTSRTLSTEGTVRQLAFSPSGHRLYAARDDRQVAVIDRFSLETVATVRLSEGPAAIRTDGSGRWMLARSPSGDSAWVIDLATHRVTATVATEWGDDLPTVAGAATLLARIDGDVVGFDLSRSGLPETGRITGAAGDLWLVSAWLPRDHARLAALAAESVLVAQDSLLVADSAAAAAARADQLYLQVSSSQNPEWSRELARQLDGAGYPARVLEPVSADDGYRVVVGPYPTRDEAAEVGRRLGRPYFILTNPPIARR
jgi:hypothetical protein